MTSKPQNLFTLLLGIILIFTATAALANEIWVAPAEEAPKKEVGNWAVTNKGDAHFNFAVPNDLNFFVGAKVVLIGRKDKEIIYDLFLSLSQDGSPHDVFTDALEDIGPVMLFKNELREIDVSAIFPDSTPGMDYITLHFLAKKQGGRKRSHGDDGKRGRGGGSKDIQVIGLRFQYDAEVFFDNTTGNVGIGTTTPDSELEVNGTVAASAFASASPLIFEAPAGTERMRIDDSTGNVGIGSTSPQAPLEVRYSSPNSIWGVPALILDNPAGGSRTTLSFRIDGENMAQFNAHDDKGITLNRDGIFKIANLANTRLDFFVNSDGNVFIGGNLHIQGNVSYSGTHPPADYVFDKQYNLETIEDHSQFMWSNKHLPAIKGKKELEAKIDMGERLEQAIEELEKAHIYIEQLHKNNRKLEKRLAKLEALLKVGR